MTTRNEKLLTDSAQPIAEEMAKRVGGVKLALSAGIIALKILSPADREKAVAIANGAEVFPVTETQRKTIRDVMREIVKKTKEQQRFDEPGTIIKITPADEKFWKKLNDLLGEEPIPQKPARKKIV